MIKDKFLPKNDPQEEIVAHLWPHPFIFFKIIIFYIVLFVIPIGSYYISLNNLPFFVTSPAWQPLIAIIGFSYYLAILMMGLTFWLNAFLSDWTITTKRIVSREQADLFHRTVSELELYRVQDVSVEQQGLLPTMLNYGDLHIQTAGEEEHFVFKNVGDPFRLSRLIQKLDEGAKRNYFTTSE